MNWIRLSLNEWMRRPLRTSVTALGIAIAVATCYSLLAFHRGYSDGVRNELDRLGAHILLVPKGCPYDAASLALHGGSWPCYLKEKYLVEVQTVPGVKVAAAVFMAAIYETNGTQAVYLGVRSNILALRPGWQIKGKFPEGEGSLLIGAEIARRRGWAVGQQVELPGLSGQ